MSPGSWLFDVGRICGDLWCNAMTVDALLSLHFCNASSLAPAAVVLI
jgi:hypothetical protein